MIRCDRCLVRLIDLTSELPYYAYGVVERLSDQLGHARYRTRGGVETFLCNAVRWQRAERVRR